MSVALDDRLDGTPARRARVAIDARGVLRLPRGMPQYVRRLATMLPTAAPDLDFLLFVNALDPYIDKHIEAGSALRALAAAPNVRVVELSSDGEMFWEQVLLPRHLRRVGADLLHMPTNRAAVLSPVPQVVTVHDAMEWKYLTRVVGMPRDASARIKLWVWRRRGYVYANYAVAMRRVEKIITDSHASAGEIARSLHAGPVQTIPLGVDEDFVPDPDPAVAHLAGRQHCLMLGGDVFQKNPEGAVRLWASLPAAMRARFPLLVVGFAGTADSPLIRAVRESECEAGVHIRGWITQPELVHAMQRAAVLLFLSREEGFGLPVLQAMACGTPVVVSRAAAVQEVAGEAAAMSVDAERPEDGTAALAALLGDDGAWADRRSAGLRRAAEFTWTQCVEAHAAVYRQCLQARSAAG